MDGHVQDFSALSRYLEQFSPDQFLEAVSDFHFLLYIATMDMLPMRVSKSPTSVAILNRHYRRYHSFVFISLTIVNA